MDRKTQAEVLLHAYSRDLERKRLSAGAAGIVLTDGEYTPIRSAKTSALRF